MRLRVRFVHKAERHIEYLDRWWRRHRAAAASQVTDEVDRITVELSESPEQGTLYARRGSGNVRWLRLRKTPYKLYSWYEPGSDEVWVVAVWSSMRKRGPPITLPK